LEALLPIVHGVFSLWAVLDKETQIIFNEKVIRWLDSSLKSADLERRSRLRVSSTCASILDDWTALYPCL